LSYHPEEILMRHPFDGINAAQAESADAGQAGAEKPTRRSVLRTFFAAVAALLGAHAASRAADPGPARPDVTTMMKGEEGGGPCPSTTASNEEGGGPRPTTTAAREEGGHLTTMRTGEEGGITRRLGEHGGRPSTTAAGEEGGRPTRAAYEEGRATTLAMFEEGGGPSVTAREEGNQR
jgi:hypothetical protein